MPASYTFGITGGATGSIIVNSVSFSRTSSKQELQGPTGNIAAVGYNKFKTEISISGVGDAGNLTVGGLLGSMPGVPSTDTYTIDSISTSRSIDGFAEFEISATKN